MKPTQSPAVRNAAGYLARRAAAASSSSVVRTAARAAGSVAASRLSTAASSAARVRHRGEQEVWCGAAAAGLATSAAKTTTGKTAGKSVWSGTLSFASPESDFTAQADVSLTKRAFPASFSSSSSSSSETQPIEDFIDHIRSDDRLRTDMAYSLSFAGSETDFTSPHMADMIDERQRRQLARAEEQATLRGSGTSSSSDHEVVKYDTRRELLDEHPQKTMGMLEDELLPSTKGGGKDKDDEEPFHFQDLYGKIDSKPLPHNLAEATSPSEGRPIVVTETSVPFRVVAVNAPWEGLCGYTQSEARGRTLGDLLQGPETDKPAVTALIDKLLHGEEAGTVLTNYAKDGRKFQNRLRVGMLKNDKGKLTHFVGVLREISERPDRFGESTSKPQVEMGKRMSA